MEREIDPRISGLKRQQILDLLRRLDSEIYIHSKITKAELQQLATKRLANVPLEPQTPARRLRSRSRDTTGTPPNPWPRDVPRTLSPSPNQEGRAPRRVISRATRTSLPNQQAPAVPVPREDLSRSTGFARPNPHVPAAPADLPGLDPDPGASRMNVTVTETMSHTPDHPDVQDIHDLLLAHSGHDQLPRPLLPSQPVRAADAPSLLDAEDFPTAAFQPPTEDMDLISFEADSEASETGTTTSPLLSAPHVTEISSLTSVELPIRNSQLEDESNPGDTSQPMDLDSPPSTSSFGASPASSRPRASAFFLDSLLNDTPATQQLSLDQLAEMRAESNPAGDEDFSFVEEVLVRLATSPSRVQPSGTLPLTLTEINSRTLPLTLTEIGNLGSPGTKASQQELPTQPQPCLVFGLHLSTQPASPDLAPEAAPSAPGPEASQQLPASPDSPPEAAPSAPGPEASQQPPASPDLAPEAAPSTPGPEASQQPPTSPDLAPEAAPSAPGPEASQQLPASPDSPPEAAPSAPGPEASQQPPTSPDLAPEAAPSAHGPEASQQPTASPDSAPEHVL
ncbi:hypothetical protein PtA15_15A2 [Puccinia triticina]|uniref:DEK C-terminal domain-containing protein n=1 Tax=Puccinia triticina TaxID=208348 RepID=A0ABY7D1Z6_9BASI|nr:uncharacterized protein PtA15_15A2 [Puccinia triticina]WAQ91613.1 hypothetical protein PtA15_15A2 [Puccinia triticina]